MCLQPCRWSHLDIRSQVLAAIMRTLPHHTPTCPTSTFLHLPTVTVRIMWVTTVENVAMAPVAFLTMDTNITLFLPPPITFHTLTPHLLEFSGCTVRVRLVIPPATVISFSLPNRSILSQFTSTKGNFSHLPSYHNVMLELVHQVNRIRTYCSRALCLRMCSLCLQPLSTRPTTSSRSARLWVKTTWCCPPGWSPRVLYWHTQPDCVLNPNQQRISTFTRRTLPRMCKRLSALLVCHACISYGRRTWPYPDRLTPKILPPRRFSSHRDKISRVSLHQGLLYSIHPQLLCRSYPRQCFQRKKKLKIL